MCEFFKSYEDYTSTYRYDQHGRPSAGVKFSHYIILFDSTLLSFTCTLGIFPIYIVSITVRNYSHICIRKYIISHYKYFKFKINFSLVPTMSESRNQATYASKAGGAITVSNRTKNSMPGSLEW